jgi:hypothetical protein
MQIEHEDLLVRHYLTQISSWIYIWSVKPTSFCRLTAKDSSSSIRSLAAARSSSFSYFICCAKPKPMHLKGESEPLDLAAFFSDLFDEELSCYESNGPQVLLVQPCLPMPWTVFRIS